jgi:hypothetical protein
MMMIDDVHDTNDCGNNDANNGANDDANDDAGGLNCIGMEHDPTTWMGDWCPPCWTYDGEIGNIYDRKGCK